MFKTGPVEEEVEEAEILTQRSNSSLQELQAGWLNKKDRNSKNPFKKRQPGEVNTPRICLGPTLCYPGGKKLMMTTKTIKMKKFSKPYQQG
jgi:hypothetical protein